MVCAVLVTCQPGVAFGHYWSTYKAQLLLEIEGTGHVECFGMGAEDKNVVDGEVDVSRRKMKCTRPAWLAGRVR